MPTLYNIPFALRHVEDGCHAALCEKRSEGGILTVGLHLSYDMPVVPKPVTLVIRIPNCNVLSTYSPLIGQMRHSRSVRPGWNPYAVDSRLTGGVPLLSMIGHEEKNSVTVALSDCKTPVTMSVGQIEETGELEFKVKLFTISGGLLSDYETDIRIDTRALPYTEVLRDVEDYWFTVNEIEPMPVPETARRPVYSTWYSYHQAVTTDALLAECRLAKALGMESIIIDDGWQTDDVNRGYSYCGDWEITKNKIPDIHALVDGIHALGMKVIFWYSVPFVGIYSKAYERFGDMLLTNKEWNKVNPWKMIDPRYPEARHFLIEKYTEAIRDWGLDGLKLDFIDSYKLEEDSCLSDPRMDTTSLFDACDLLMREVRDSLTALKGDVLLEFRQAYVGPYMQTYGNMFRVGDCPNDCLTNRLSACDMRLVMHRTAIHSDMLMWGAWEDSKTAARQLLHIFFTVPQISVRLSEIPESHTRMLRHYLALWNACRETLLAGEFVPEGVDGSYTMVHIDGEKEHFCLAYGKSMKRYAGEKTLYYVNVTGDETLYLDLTAKEPRALRVYDCEGNLVTEGELADGIHAIRVPLSGMAVLAEA